MEFRLASQLVGTGADAIRLTLTSAAASQAPTTCLRLNDRVPEEVGESAGREFSSSRGPSFPTSLQAFILENGGGRNSEVHPVFLDTGLGDDK